jgi:hypothetical protein
VAGIKQKQQDSIYEDLHTFLTALVTNITIDILVTLVSKVTNAPVVT